jgi:hypothetical protein
VALQRNNLPPNVWPRWQNFILDAVQKSPVVSEHLTKHAHWYSAELNAIVKEKRPQRQKDGLDYQIMMPWFASSSRERRKCTCATYQIVFRCRSRTIDVLLGELFLSSQAVGDTDGTTSDSEMPSPMTATSHDSSCVKAV